MESFAWMQKKGRIGLGQEKKSSIGSMLNLAVVVNKINKSKRRGRGEVTGQIFGESSHLENW